MYTGKEIGTVKVSVLFDILRSANHVHNSKNTAIITIRLYWALYLLDIPFKKTFSSNTITRALLRVIFRLDEFIKLPRNECE
jgi:hypothetical protein